jgi:hypothetical protein
MHPTFTLAHISDLHFSPGAYRDGSHQHSISRLKGIQRLLSNIDIDRLIVSGDVTNDGDAESLLRAHSWLFGKFPIDGNEEIGMGLAPDKVGVIPGNHDAYNDDSAGAISLLDCWQKSLSNYNDIFVNHKFVYPESSRYDWIQKDGRGIFLVYVDTSFVGDPELEKKGDYRSLLTRISKIARGKFRREQSEQILEWFQLGIKGKLQHPTGTPEFIPGQLFAESLKILVAHHYLFEPRGQKVERLLHLTHAKSIFVNIASADFDIYLCGHKHIHDLAPSTYGKHLDRKGKGRHLLNLFRRSIGIDMLPIRMKDEKGNWESKALTFLLTLLYVKEKVSSAAHAVEEEADGRFVDEFVNALQSALQEPNALEKQVSSFLNQYKIPDDELLHSNELREIQRRLKTQFSSDERQQLKILGMRIQRFARQLSSRPFLQFMAGSSAKETVTQDRKRSFKYLSH